MSAAYSCIACGLASTSAADTCPRCRGHKTIVRAKGPAKAKVKTVRVRDVAHAAEVRATTGTPAIDRALGGGAHVPSSILIYGRGGVGKTTRLVVAAAHQAAAIGRDALYLSAEMSQAKVAAAARRLGGGEDVWITETSDADDACAEVRARKPGVIVWDSIQAFWINGQVDTETSISALVRRAIEVGAELGAVTWLICQVTKEGKPAGPAGILHAADTLLALGNKTIACRKSRFAPQGRYALPPLVPEDGKKADVSMETREV